MGMTIFLIILGIYIGMVIISLLGLYVDFRRNHCEKGKRYTLEDFHDKTDDLCWTVCFIPFINVITVVLTLVWLLVIPLWKRIKNIRIV